MRPPEYYRRVREICDEFGVLLIYRRDHQRGRAYRQVSRRALVAGCEAGSRDARERHRRWVLPAGRVSRAGAHGGCRRRARVVSTSGTRTRGIRWRARWGSRCSKRRSSRSSSSVRMRWARICAARSNALQSEVPILGDVRGLGMLNAIEIVADQASKAMLPRSLDVLGRIQAHRARRWTAHLRPAHAWREVRRLGSW